MKSKFEVHKTEVNNKLYGNGFSMVFENGYTISVVGWQTTNDVAKMIDIVSKKQ